MTSPEDLRDYLMALTTTWVTEGLQHAVVCPGSRSTPIALALTETPGLRLWMALDERSAGFFALGMAASLDSPVLLLSTSGTAAANFLPAVVEAHLTRIPLVILTADRPRELRDVGAAQTIDQVRLYGTHVKWFQDMPSPASDLIDYASLVAARAAHLANSSPKGPVHLNFPLREPLIPATRPDHQTMAAPTPRFFASHATPDSQALHQVVVTRLASEPRGILIAGARFPQDAEAPLAQLALKLGWPILADPLSNLRHLATNITAYDSFLKTPGWRDQLAPNMVLRVGAPPTSKPLNQWISQASLVLVEEPGGFREPNRQSPWVLEGDIPETLRRLAEAVPARDPGEAHWQSLWQKAQSLSEASIAGAMERLPDSFEGRLFYQLMALLDDGRPMTIVVGNSMPIRDLDSFYLRGARHVRLWANRGANGIDGVVSTAMGVAAQEGRSTLILGDISFYHDMNGLLAAKLHALNSLVIVINNNGGGIFSFLPQKAVVPETTFETLFGTPHAIDFAGTATLYGGRFWRADSFTELAIAVKEAAPQSGLRIVEWRTASRTDNVAWHREVAIPTEMGGNDNG